MNSILEGDVKRLIAQVERWLKLEAADKAIVLLTCVIVTTVLCSLAVSAVFFISFGIMKALAAVIGSEMLSCFVVGAVLVVCAWVVYRFRKPLIENRVVESVSRQMFESHAESAEEKGGGQ